VIDIYLQQLREIQEDATRLQAKAVASAGQPEGEAINLDQALRKLEEFQATALPSSPTKSPDAE
jgi:hypothetical protein